MTRSHAHLVEVPETIRSREDLAGADRAITYELAADDARSTSAEQWARASWEGAPTIVRRLLTLGWRFALGLQRPPGRSPTRPVRVRKRAGLCHVSPPLGYVQRFAAGQVDRLAAFVDFGAAGVEQRRFAGESFGAAEFREDAVFGVVCHVRRETAVRRFTPCFDDISGSFRFALQHERRCPGAALRDPVADAFVFEAGDQISSTECPFASRPGAQRLPDLLPAKCLSGQLRNLSR